MGLSARRVGPSERASAPRANARTAAVRRAVGMFPSVSRRVRLPPSSVRFACNPPCRDAARCASGGDVATRAPPPRDRTHPRTAASCRRRREPFADRGFVMLGFHYGFPGTLGGRYGGQRHSARVDVWFQPARRRAHRALLAARAALSIRRVARRLTPEPNRSYYIDVDLYVRARTADRDPVDELSILGRRSDWSHVRHPRRSRRTRRSEAGIGLERRLHGAAAPFISRRSSASSPRLGWMQHKVTHDAEPTSIYVRLSQWILNIGFVFPRAQRAAPDHRLDERLPTFRGPLSSPLLERRFSKTKTAPRTLRRSRTRDGADRRIPDQLGLSRGARSRRANRQVAARCLPLPRRASRGPLLSCRSTRRTKRRSSRTFCATPSRRSSCADPKRPRYSSGWAKSERRAARLHARGARRGDPRRARSQARPRRSRRRRRRAPTLRFSSTHRGRQGAPKARF